MNQAQGKLKNLSLSTDAKSGLKKIISDACSSPLFHLFSLMDGVADPENEDIGEWYGIDFSEKDENTDTTLHDDFFETYWDYNDKS